MVSDKETYDSAIYIGRDQTVDLPPTSRPDLTFEIKLIKGGESEILKREVIQGYPSPNEYSLKIQLTDEGTYYLQLTATDEVGNSTSNGEYYPYTSFDLSHDEYCKDNDGDRYGEGPECLGPDCDDNNREVNPAAEVTDGRDNDCDGGIDENIVRAGNPQVTLFWENSSDLDLHVYSPGDECHLYFNNENCGGGHLDRDAKANCRDPTAPPENIY